MRPTFNQILSKMPFNNWKISISAEPKIISEKQPILGAKKFPNNSTLICLGQKTTSLDRDSEQEISPFVIRSACRSQSWPTDMLRATSIQPRHSKSHIQLADMRHHWTMINPLHMWSREFKVPTEIWSQEQKVRSIMWVKSHDRLSQSPGIR